MCFYVQFMGNDFEYETINIDIWQNILDSDVCNYPVVQKTIEQE